MFQYRPYTPHDANWERALTSIGGPVTDKEQNFVTSYIKLKNLARQLEDAIAGRRQAQKGEGGKIQVLYGNQWKNVEDDLASLERNLHN